MATILVVEDDTSLREVIEYNLSKNGYQTKTAADGISAIEEARKIKPDLILLDVNLPGVDGFEVCRIIRKEMAVPILLVTARDDEIDRVIGLEIGADDYITKPFSMRELVARVKAHLRREKLLAEYAQTPEKAASQKMVFNNLVIDLDRHEVFVNSTLLALKPQEYALLLYLAEHQGRAVSREKLLEEVWGWDYTGNSRTVDVHISWLREKIEKDAGNPQRIITVRGAGYLFEG
jgi:DNA-binding response OmpR family regulator